MRKEGGSSGRAGGGQYAAKVAHNLARSRAAGQAREGVVSDTHPPNPGRLPRSLPPPAEGGCANSLASHLLLHCLDRRQSWLPVCVGLWPHQHPVHASHPKPPLSPTFLSPTFYLLHHSSLHFSITSLNLSHSCVLPLLPSIHPILPPPYVYFPFFRLCLFLVFLSFPSVHCSFPPIRLSSHLIHLFQAAGSSLPSLSLPSFLHPVYRSFPPIRVCLYLCVIVLYKMLSKQCQ